MKRAIVTGGSRGIGKAILQELGLNGYSVSSLNVKSGFDVGIEASWRSLESLGKVGPGSLDVMVLNAGIAFWDYGSEFENHTDLVNTDLLGVYYGLHYAQKWMKKGGVVVVVTSSSAYKISPLQPPLYGAVKRALVYLIESYGIRNAGKFRVIGVAPGFCPTGLGGSDGTIPQELLDTIPVKRAMEPDELARYVMQLIGFEYLTATDVIIDGASRFYC